MIDEELAPFFNGAKADMVFWEPEFMLPRESLHLFKTKPGQGTLRLKANTVSEVALKTILLHSFGCCEEDTELIFETLKEHKEVEFPVYCDLNKSKRVLNKLFTNCGITYGIR
jgi:hypothetical protein